MAKAKLDHGRGTGIPSPIDVHVGARVRQRRTLLGMSQTMLGDAIDLTFQQVHVPRQRLLDRLSCLHKREFLADRSP